MNRLPKHQRPYLGEITRFVATETLPNYKGINGFGLEDDTFRLVMYGPQSVDPKSGKKGDHPPAHIHVIHKQSGRETRFELIENENGDHHMTPATLLRNNGRGHPLTNEEIRSVGPLLTQKAELFIRLWRDLYLGDPSNDLSGHVRRDGIAFSQESEPPPPLIEGRKVGRHYYTSAGMDEKPVSVPEHKQSRRVKEQPESPVEDAWQEDAPPAPKSAKIKRTTIHEESVTSAHEPDLDRLEWPEYFEHVAKLKKDERAKLKVSYPEVEEFKKSTVYSDFNKGVEQPYIQLPKGFAQTLSLAESDVQRTAELCRYMDSDAVPPHMRPGLCIAINKLLFEGKEREKAKEQELFTCTTLSNDVDKMAKLIRTRYPHGFINEFLAILTLIPAAYPLADYPNQLNDNEVCEVVRKILQVELGLNDEQAKAIEIKDAQRIRVPSITYTYDAITGDRELTPGHGVTTKTLNPVEVAKLLIDVGLVQIDDAPSKPVKPAKPVSPKPVESKPVEIKILEDHSLNPERKSFAEQFLDFSHLSPEEREAQHPRNNPASLISKFKNSGIYFIKQGKNSVPYWFFSQDIKNRISNGSEKLIRNIVHDIFQTTFGLRDEQLYSIAVEKGDRSLSHMYKVKLSPIVYTYDAETGDAELISGHYRTTKELTAAEVAQTLHEELGIPIISPETQPINEKGVLFSPKEGWGKHS